MKNLEEKIKILNQNRGENSLYEYVYCESQGDPNFFRWLFEEEFNEDFDLSLSDEQREQFKNWVEKLKREFLLEKWIVVRFSYADNDDTIRVTCRRNFEKMNLCEAYADYGQKVGCYQAGCYSLDNSSSDALKDLIQAISEKFGIEENNINIIESGEIFEIEAGDGEEFGFNEDAVNKFISEWREINEYHTEVVGWIYHDSHNFKTVVLEADFGETDCVELEEEEQIQILQQMPEKTPYIEGTNTSVETEDFIFHFDRWATNPYFCYVEKK